MGVYGSPDLYPKNSSNKYTDWGKKMVHCKKCHAVYHKAFSRCPECNAKNPKKGKLFVWIPLAVVGTFCIILMFGSTANLMRGKFAGALAGLGGTEQLYVQPQETEEEFKEKCVIIPYKDIERNPNDYIGQYAIFEGKVVQVEEDGSNIILRVDTRQGKYGFWYDTVYVDYQRKDVNESRILEDDIVTMYGIVKGIKTYRAILGNSVSIPHLEARYIELKTE